MKTKVPFLCQKTPLGYLAKDWSGQCGKDVAYSAPYPTHQAMTTQATTTTLDLTRITIGAFKHFAGMSEETEAFTANVLLDGKVIAYADNHGKGGCTHVRFLGDNRHNMEVHQTRLADHVDTLIDALLIAKHDQKFIAKMRKKARETVAYLTADCGKGQYIAHKKGAMVDLNRVTSKQGFVKFVADMTDAEILAHFAA